MVAVTRKKSHVISDDTKEELENLFVSPDDSPDDSAIDNMLSELQSAEGANVKVYRVLANNKLSWIYDVHPVDFKMEDLRDAFGGGRFRIFIYNTIEGRKTLQSSQFVNIEAPKTQQPVTQNNQSDVSALVQAMMLGMQKGFEGLGQLIVQNNKQVQPVDPIAMQTSMLQNMLVMKQVMGGGESTGGIEKALEMLQTGIKMGKELTPEPVGESTGTDVLLQAVKSIAPAFIQAQAQAQAQVQQQPRIIPAQTQPVIAPLPQTQVNQGDEMFAMKKWYLNVACQKAAQNADPMLYADLVLDNLPENEIIAIVSAPDPINELAKIEPLVLNHREWFSNLITEINAGLQGIDEPLTGVMDSDIKSDTDIPAEILDAINANPNDEFTDPID